MNFKSILTKATNVACRTGLKIKEASPEILVTTGVVAGVAAIALCIAETRKLDSVTAKANEEIDRIHVQKETTDVTVYSDRQYKKDLTKAYAKKVGSYVQLYWPTFTSFGLSMTCFLSAYGVMKQRNVALAAAYKALETGYNAYRQRVRDELGDEMDKHFQYGFDSVKKVEDPSGNVYEVETSDENPNDLSVYARCFDASSTQWMNNAEYNFTYIRDVEKMLNRKLDERGHLFLNEVYDALGLQRSQAGQIVGWVKGAQGKDGYVRFDIFKNVTAAQSFVNGYSPDIWIDFNVDGPIHNLI